LRDTFSVSPAPAIGPSSLALRAGRQPLATLEKIRRVSWFIPGIGEYNFAGQYQQAPAPQGGGMVKAAWLRSYAPNERPAAFRPHCAELGHRQ